MDRARWWLVSLWVSQTARVLADSCLGMFVVVEVARWGQGQHHAAWHLVSFFFILPFVLLAPINGAIGNGWPKRWVLAASSFFCLAVAGFFGTVAGLEGNSWGWWTMIGLTALGGAIYSPTRYALYPAAARDAHLPLSRING
ncbi:MAG: hypothetical protein JO112_14855, partial [Planctomycetes bacterium]|nr:hypothetical protein [Planctomycetota bacterium]